MLTLLASFAQAESEQISANVKWGIRRGYQAGRLHSRAPYGYRFNDGALEVIESEAVVVRRLFDDYLAGITPEATAEALNAEGVRPRRVRAFTGKTMRRFLENEHYTGGGTGQALYRTKIADGGSCAPNTGELPKYLMEDTHPPIIDRATFNAVQGELKRRREVGRARTPTGGSSALTSRIVCSVCGQHFHRRTRTTSAGNKYRYWWCWTATQGQGNPCKALQVREELLKTICLQALALTDRDGEAVLTGINDVTVSPDKVVTISLTNGGAAHFNYRSEVSRVG